MKLLSYKAAPGQLLRLRSEKHESADVLLAGQIAGLEAETSPAKVRDELGNDGLKPMLRAPEECRAIADELFAEL
jgi:hypothetical protein